MHAGSFRLSVIHRTLTWTTGSFTCVRDHSLFDSKTTASLSFPCAPDGIPTLYQLSHHQTGSWRFSFSVVVVVVVVVVVAVAVAVAVAVVVVAVVVFAAWAF